MPANPDCHGREYSPVGSQVGFCRDDRRFFAFGILSSGSLSTHPREIRRPAIQNVGASMSGSIERPFDSRGWIFAKYSLLSLYSSVYLNEMPEAFSKRSTVSSSM